MDILMCDDGLFHIKSSWQKCPYQGL